MHRIARLLAQFRRDETGAVTVDWVVLTAAIVSLGTLAVAALVGSMGQVTTKVSDHISSVSISTNL
jgi:Flp pilus assembly pilin Flp